MLPSNLLRIKIKGNEIMPVFAEINDENLYLADSLLEIYRSCVGKKIGDLEEAIKEEELKAEDLGYDFKFFRGLKTLLDRRLVLEEFDDSIDPIRVRALVFELANNYKDGLVIDEKDRASIFDLAAQKLGIDSERLKEIFLSVYEEEQKIKDFNDLRPEELLRFYNLSLMQTLMFKCRKLYVDVQISGGEMRRLLWLMKKLHLLYLAEQSYFGINLAIDGPASVIKQTERYGTRMAHLLPLLIQTKNWHIRAYISLKTKFKKIKVLRFELSKNYSMGLFPSSVGEEISYDSYVEEEFSKKFFTASAAWQIVREPEPLVVGRSIFIPDFALINGDKKVYLEIMGFWSEDYIKRKIEKLQALKDANLILAIDSSLGKINLERTNGNIEIVLYEKKLSSADILRALKKFESS
ncbi:MAG TPA: DUF790 family protein [Geobacterales bacterium]|nr:DUF790 family protein [Geobacterales bacterium]